MSFTDKSVQLAKEVMTRKNPGLAEKFGTLFSFLVDNPESFSGRKRQSKVVVGSEEFFTAQADNFIRSRDLRAPNPPATVPDEMVSFIINEYFDVPESELKRAVELHSLCMGAENLVGDILERYIASVVEPLEWVWCSGSIIRAVDFIHKKKDGSWGALQVKNRDNSENSSSSSVRDGTTIEKWFRCFSTKSGDNWSNFPKVVNANLSEAGFKKYVDDYLKRIKNG
jgi:SinI restriction endonuclease